MTPFPIDQTRGKVALIFAHGPSARKHVPDLVNKSHDKQHYVFISMGEIDRMQANLGVSFGLDYWVMANSEMTVENSYNRFNSIPGSTLVWADTADRTPYSIAWSKLKVPSISYDQRHFNNQPCPNCKVPLNIDGRIEWAPVACRVIPGRLTIQEELQKYTKYHEHYGTGSTVALHAVSLGVLLGCKEVHVYGVDLSYSGGYVDNKTESRQMASFDNEMIDIVKDFDTITKSAHNIGVRVINHSPESPLSKVMETII